MSKRPLLSIVIPTRNRQYYAESAVRQTMAISPNRIQVVVQDNSDKPDLGVRLKDFDGAEGFSYAHCGGEVSFAENFDRGVRRATGEYVCVIGDDDGLLPASIDVLEWAALHGIQAITPSLDAVYYWPGSVQGKRSHLGGSLVVSHSRSRAHISSPRSALDKLVLRGGQDYLNLPLVKIYHGFVSRHLLELVHAKTGRYFGGLSPDIYSSVALSSVTGSCLFLDWPITLPGICRTSGSADSASGRHVGQLTEAPHFRGNSDYEWSPEVPGFYSVETIWADSCLAALREMGEHEYLRRFNADGLRTILKSKYPEYATPSVAPARIRDGATLARHWIRRGTNSAHHRWTEFLHPAKQFSDLNSIEDAVAIFSDEVEPGSTDLSRRLNRSLRRRNAK